ncbi:hypothetical protein GGR39_003400 [Novosphingobium fluoreni]|uniref:Uncharacterized protein n=1 Tax=Novosphingobium fluoreni TaxID=1391222 RepID=A0A7W6C1G2_9SPHN|nr:hypothetical protein [Novosphingobium fluoreni]
MADHLRRDVPAVHHTVRNGAPVYVSIARYAGDCAAIYDPAQRRCRVSPTLPCRVVNLTRLPVLWCINPVQPDLSAPDFKAITINSMGGSSDGLRKDGLRQRDSSYDGEADHACRLVSGDYQMIDREHALGPVIADNRPICGLVLP